MKATKEFIQFNKNYYKYIEEYDWVEVTDNFKGLESVFHRLRQFLTLRLINRYKKGNKILDAGCGTGLILRKLPKGTVGIDINPRNIKKAKRYAQKAKVIIADIEKLPFKKDTFSTIISAEVIEHQPNPIPTINELRRVLKKGGVLIGSVPAISPIWFLRLLPNIFPKGEPFHKNFKQQELKKIFKQFKIIKLSKAILGMNYFFVLEKK